MLLEERLLQYYMQPSVPAPYYGMQDLQDYKPPICYWAASKRPESFSEP